MPLIIGRPTTTTALRFVQPWLSLPLSHFVYGLSRRAKKRWWIRATPILNGIMDDHPPCDGLHFSSVTSLIGVTGVFLSYTVVDVPIVGKSLIYHFYCSESKPCRIVAAVEFGSVGMSYCRRMGRLHVVVLRLWLFVFKDSRTAENQDSRCIQKRLVALVHQLCGKVLFVLHIFE